MEREIKLGDIVRLSTMDKYNLEILPWARSWYGTVIKIQQSPSGLSGIDLAGTKHILVRWFKNKIWYKHKENPHAKESFVSERDLIIL